MKKRMTTVLRELMAQDKIIVHPGIHDAISAQLAENAGFPMVALGGTALGLQLGFGEPRLCLEDLLTVCRYITAAIDVPLKVDAGPGFGDTVQIQRTILELERAGVASCHLEDCVFPHRATHCIGVDPLIDPDEMCEKIKVAAAARNDKDFVIVARTNSMKEFGFEEGVRRINMYLDAGADAAYVFPNNMEEAERAPKLVNGPCCFNNSEGGTMPNLTVEQAQNFGYKFITYPGMSITLMGIALKKGFDYLMANGQTDFDVNAGGDIINLMRKFGGTPEMCDLELAKDAREAARKNK